MLTYFCTLRFGARLQHKLHYSVKVLRVPRGALAFAIGDSALSKIVRGQLDRHAVSWHDANVVFPHLTGDVSYNPMAVLEFDNKLSPWKGLDNYPR